MQKPKFNAENVSKFVARHCVTAIVASSVKKALEGHTPQSEKLDTAGMIGALAGWYAGEQLEPYTDAVVEEIFQKIRARRTNKLEQSND